MDEKTATSILTLIATLQSENTSVKASYDFWLKEATRLQDALNDANERIKELEAAHENHE